MMKLSVYLHKEIVAILHCFGDLDKVVNDILDAGANGCFNLMDKPSCPSRENASRYEINISDPTYLELLSTYGPTSPRISIRRLIYWFVENEIYEELEWEQTSVYLDRQRQLFTKKLANALNEMSRAIAYAPTKAKTETINIYNKIKELQEYVQNGN